MIETAIYVVLGVTVLLGAEAVYHTIRYMGERQRAQLRRRMRTLAEPGGTSLLRERRIARNRTLARLLRHFPMADRMEALLLQTDLNWTVGTVLGFSLVIAAGLTGGLLFLVRDNPVFALAGIPIGCAIPPLVVMNVRSKRSQKISTQMSDALDMMARSLQAGHGVSSGFKLVATEMPPPIAVEFGRCFEEHNLGVEFREAVANMTHRVPENLDLKLFVVSVVIQHETGGNLVEILEKISLTIRERYKFYGKLRALTAEAKVSGVILGTLPFVCGAALVVINPQYLKPLLVDPLGQLFLLGGLALWGIGVLWMRSLAQIDY